MYRVAICDDESIFLESLKLTVSEILIDLGVDHLIASYSNINLLQQKLDDAPDSFDILLLNILLGDDDGVAFAKRLRAMGSDVSILFITSTRDYSLDGYSVYPIHYLLKPPPKELLAEVFRRDLVRATSQNPSYFPPKREKARWQLTPSFV